jgi:hypothetical protein
LKRERFADSRLLPSCCARFRHFAAWSSSGLSESSRRSFQQELGFGRAPSGANALQQPINRDDVNRAPGSSVQQFVAFTNADAAYQVRGLVANQSVGHLDAAYLAQSRDC